MQLHIDVCLMLKKTVCSYTDTYWNCVKLTKSFQYAPVFIHNSLTKINTQLCLCIQHTCICTNLLLHHHLLHILSISKYTQVHLEIIDRISMRNCVYISIWQTFSICICVHIIAYLHTGTNDQLQTSNCTIVPCI